MADRKTSRAAKVIREICNRRRNSDIRADDREVQAAFDALLDSVDPPWRSMETAPADGTPILYAVRSGDKVLVTAGRWTEHGWYEINVDASDNWGLNDHPEVWMPMPEAKLP